MAEFYVSLSKQTMAAQISVMINMYNRLYSTKTAELLLLGPTNYFVEVEGGLVIGCVGLRKINKNISEIKHVCVLPAHRRKGIAKRLINLAIANCATKYVSIRSREDNVPSIKMAQALKFIPTRKIWSTDHFVIESRRAVNNG